MHVVRTKSGGSRFRGVVSVLAVAMAMIILWAPTARPADVGHIIGNVDGISRDGEQYFISGWACQQGHKDSIPVRIFGDVSTRSPFLTAGMANLDSEPAVNEVCQDRAGGYHRFLIVLPIGYTQVNSLGVEGFILGGTDKAMLRGSGKPLAPRAGLNAPFPPPIPPRLSGAYHSPTGHPRVFVTTEELKDMASRINRPGSYSMERFNRLVADVKHDLTSGIDWNVVYSGCMNEVYQHMISVEVAAGVEDLLRTNLHLGPDAKLPRGGAVVASRLALYAALLKAGASAPQGAPTADQAVALAKRILLAWADHGFPRDAQGHFRLLPALACERSGQINLLGASGPSLKLGGIAFSVHAQDLLQFLGVFTADETRRLDAFHQAMFDIIRQADNVKFGYGGIPFPAPRLARYNNIDSGALAVLLAIARLQDDKPKFNAVLYGGDPSIPVVLPWFQFFNRTIYGESDKPLECGLNTIECPHNPKDPPKFPGFQTVNAAPGEITDRLRNEGALSGFGYAAGNLRTLIKAAEILRLSGFDAYAYRGVHKQSIEMSIAYYSCFGETPGFYKTVTAENSSSCANAEQYYDKIVNDVDRVVMFGAYRFPNNKSIVSLDESAKIASRAFPIDTTIFGRWRD